MMALVRGVMAASSVQVDVARDRVDVGEHRRGAHFDDDVGRGHPRDRRGDDFVAGPMPAMRSAISMVQVPELKVRTMRPPRYSDSAFSNA
jgi:hypothetical protein